MNRIKEYHDHLFECQARAIRLEMEEGADEGEIAKRLEEFKNHIINSESINNRFRNPALNKIWASKRNY